MYALLDTFNNNIISRHRSIAAAVNADRKLQRRFVGGSYLPTTVKRIEAGELVTISDGELEEMLARYES